jgi:hypothetical protein
MNDVRDSEPGADGTRKQLIDLFLRRSVSEIEQMRRGVPNLIKGDDAAWREVRFNAQRMAGTASGLHLGILSACAGELAALADERFARVAMDAHFLLSVTSAIEMVAIEVTRLLNEPARP